MIMADPPASPLIECIRKHAPLCEMMPRKCRQPQAEAHDCTGIKINDISILSCEASRMLLTSDGEKNRGSSSDAVSPDRKVRTVKPPENPDRARFRRSPPLGRCDRPGRKRCFSPPYGWSSTDNFMSIVKTPTLDIFHCSSHHAVSAKDKRQINVLT